MPHEERLLLIELTYFLSKEMDRETVEKEALQEGGSHTVPVSDEKMRAIQSTGVPGNCCPLVIQCHQSKSLCVCRLFPWCPLLHIVSAAKLLVQSECSKRSQQRLSEDDCHLWGVEVIASSVPERHSLVTLCGCGEMLTTHHTQFTGIAELGHFGNEAI